jgi:hypothetical protein
MWKTDKPETEEILYSGINQIHFFYLVFKKNLLLQSSINPLFQTIMYLTLLPRLSPPVYTSKLVLQVRHAGHNKWSNIRHIKGARDLELAKGGTNGHGGGYKIYFFKVQFAVLEIFFY